MNHYKEVCTSCGIIVSQCRCPAENKHVVPVVCATCQATPRPPAAGAPTEESPDAIIATLTHKLLMAEAARDVLNGTVCAENMAAGRGPCGACTPCLRAQISRLQADVDRLKTSEEHWILVADGVHHDTRCENHWNGIPDWGPCLRCQNEALRATEQAGEIQRATDRALEALWTQLQDSLTKNDTLNTDTTTTPKG